MGITKDAENVICYLYKIYLDRRKDNISRDEAAFFEEEFFYSDKKLSKISASDLDSYFCELKENGYIKYDVCGNVEIKNEAIVYMENRFKNNILALLDIVSKFIP
ncbi:MAG: hypothetical protein IJ737_08075 [Ruminococcus sp.]|nr:hypothetical protein [Ruminococcus sp.]